MTLHTLHLAIFANSTKGLVMITTMNISLPDTLKSFIDARVKSGGYSSHSEYLRDLVRRDELAEAQTRLQDRLAKGLTSPPGRSWDQIEKDLRARIPTGEA
jgi:antitoxin ParD1/3/4